MTRRLVPALARLSPRERRALSLGAWTCCLVLVVQLGVRPYRALVDRTRGQAAQERDLIAREQALLRAVTHSRPRLERAEAALLTAAPRLLPGGDPATTSAELSTYLTGTALKHRVFIQESETRPPENAGEGLVKLRVELRGLGDLEGVLTFIRTIENGPRLLTIDALSIRPAELGTAGEDYEGEVLGFGAVVAGFALSDSSEVSR